MAGEAGDAPGRLTAALEGRYEIQRELGAGGMATVYLARDVRHDRDVAIKVLKPELAAVIGGERFITEIRTTANLQHPHILPLFDSGESDGFLYYVMPYVDGESLRDKLDRERQLGVEESIRIAKAVASALEYAHEEGVIHRDIKPENILLHRGQPVVADFGIALALSAAGGGRMTETGLSLGTPHYMSPEQAAADRDLTSRSDVYSLACVLYEMLAGDPPHTGPSAQAILMRILTDTPRSVTEVRPAVAPHIASVLAKALEKLPADRFESAEAFSKALDDPGFSYATRTRAGTVLTGGAELAGTRERIARTWFSDPRTLGLSGAALAALLLALFGWLRTPERSDIPPYHLDLEVGDLDTGEMYRSLAISPDGSAIVLAARRENGEQGLYLRRADENEFQFIPGTEDGSMPAFSPEGTSLVFVQNLPGSGGSLMAIPLAGGRPRTLLSGTGVNPFLPHWGEDGTIVFTGPGGLQRIPATGGTTPEVLGVGMSTYPHILPDGSGVLFNLGGRGPAGGVGIGLIDTETLSVDTLVTEGSVATYLHSGHILYGHSNRSLLLLPFDLGSHRVTGDPIPILDGVPGDEYAVSRNGTLVYGSATRIVSSDERAAAEPQRRLMVLDLEGNGGPDPLPARDFTDVRWSPNGESVAYASGVFPGSAIFTYDIELGTTPVQRTFDRSDRDPIWSPDGTRIVFSSTETGVPPDRDLYILSVESGEPAQLLLTRPDHQDPVAWPSEDVIVFEDGSTFSGRTIDLWRLTLGDSAVASPYLPQDALVVQGTVAPGGRHAAYSSNESGTTEVYVRAYPDPGQETQISDGGGVAPRWSPEGRTIYYWRTLPAGTPDTLFAAHLETDPVISVISTEALLNGDFEAGSWDLHPDGDRLIVPTATTRTTAPGTRGAATPSKERFYVVVNWFESIRARLGEGGR